jgi:hypothetical protein
MEIDRDKVDEAVLALLSLGIHDENEYGGRAWKGFDWNAMNRLHEKGLIGDPVSKAKSVMMTSANIAAAEKAFQKLFGK